MRQRQSSGFTLIELSIVLVIIGLLIGGVLVGRDLIAAATIRAQITQIEKYNTEVNTFFGKYNNIPGDMVWQKAKSLGLFVPTSSCDFFPIASQGCGDGNGVLEIPGIPTGGLTNQFGGEQLIFWRQLTDSALIDGAYGVGAAGKPGHISANDQPDYGATSLAEISAYYPAAKIGRSTSVAAFSFNSMNYFWVGNFLNMAAFGAYGQGSNSNYGIGTITGAEAFAIDTKMDDGMPFTGTVISGDLYPIGGGDDLSGNCATWNATTKLVNYIVSHLNNSNGLGCHMAFKFN